MTPLKPSACFLSCIDGTVWGQQLNFFISFSVIFRKRFSYWPGLFTPLPSLVEMELFGQGTCHPNPAGYVASSGVPLKFGECFCNHHGKKLPVGWEIYTYIYTIYPREDPSGLGPYIAMKNSLVSPVTVGSTCGEVWKVKLGRPWHWVLPHVSP